MAHRIVSASVFGFLLLAGNACTITIQSGPASPGTLGYYAEAPTPALAAAPAPAVAAPTPALAAAPAPAVAAPTAPVYVPVVAAPSARALETGVIARPATRVSTVPTPARAPARPDPNWLISSGAPGRAAQRPTVYTSVPVAHTEASHPVSATLRSAPSPARLSAPPTVPSLAPRKTGDPQALKKTQAGRS